MNKMDLIKQICKENNKSLDESKDIVNIVLNTISYNLSQGNNITLSNFGTFSLSLLKNRKVTLPSKDIISASQKYSLRFKPSKKIKQIINIH